MLKLGFAFQENGDLVAARRYLETLVDRFPESDEAAKARARLAEL
jgi:TolA-binding protein